MDNKWDIVDYATPNLCKNPSFGIKSRLVADFLLLAGPVEASGDRGRGLQRVRRDTSAVHSGDPGPEAGGGGADKRQREAPISGRRPGDRCPRTVPYPGIDAQQGASFFSLPLECTGIGQKRSEIERYGELKIWFRSYLNSISILEGTGTGSQKRDFRRSEY